MNEKQFKPADDPKVKSSSMIPGFILIAIGAISLLSKLFGLPFGFPWPIWIIVPGMMLLMPAFRLTPNNRAAAAGLAIPGATLMMVGSMLWVMDIFNHYEAWAYAWALIPIASMLGLKYAQRFDEDETGSRHLDKGIRTMGWIFVVGAIFFEGFIFDNVLGRAWPAILIVFGVFLLIQNRRDTRTTK